MQRRARGIIPPRADRAHSLNTDMSLPTFAVSRPRRLCVRTWGRASGVLVAAVLAAAGAVAAEPAKPAVNKAGAAKPAAKAVRNAAPPAAPGKPIEPLLSRDELRACMDRQTRLRELTTETTQLQETLGQEKAEIVRDGETLKAELATLDRSDVAAVASYNARAVARDQRIDAFEPRVKDFNAKADTLATDRAAYTRQCENRKFDEKDEKALAKP